VSLTSFAIFQVFSLGGVPNSFSSIVGKERNVSFYKPERALTGRCGYLSATFTATMCSDYLECFTRSRSWAGLVNWK